MKKRLVWFAILVGAAAAVWAGDVSQFVDLGFSPDGRYYMFGQYGLTDKAWQAYAEIYTVDMSTNDLVPSGVFKTAPSRATAGKTGKATFDELLKKAQPVMQKYAISTRNEGNPLYVLSEERGVPAQIDFRDFEKSGGAHTYAVRVTKMVDGDGTGVESSFYLIIEKRDAQGTVIERFTGGSPAVRRRGVADYRIQAIYPDSTGSYLLFVVEKTVIDATGTSIRYMVEAVTPPQAQ